MACAEGTKYQRSHFTETNASVITMYFSTNLFEAVHNYGGAHISFSRVRIGPTGRTLARGFHMILVQTWSPFQISNLSYLPNWQNRRFCWLGTHCLNSRRVGAR